MLELGLNVCATTSVSLLKHPLHGLLQAGGGANTFVDRSVAQSAGCLEEAWAWGFDVDVWRAHLNPLTWPEVHALLARPPAALLSNALCTPTRTVERP